MKILASAIFALSFFALAAEKYGVYDLQGNRVSTFEAEPYELPEKTWQIKNGNPHKNLYISSFKKGKSSKPSSRYRYKAETGAYLEASRKETFSVCPDKEIEGTWISEHSVALNAENCLSVQVPNLAGTFRILFIENSGLTDTIQILMEQSYINMGDYSHKVWIPNPEPERKYRGIDGGGRSDGRYESRKYEQSIIVDKTELTMGDAQYYSQFGIKLNPWNTRYYLPGEDLKTSMRPFVGHYEAWELANMRSKLEDLDIVYGRREGWDCFFVSDNSMPECIFHNKILRRIENCDRKTCMSKLEMLWEDTIKHKGLSITKKDEKCRCSLMEDDMAYTTRLLRKTPKLHKLEKF